jgi:hypothetical protein
MYWFDAMGSMNSWKMGGANYPMLAAGQVVSDGGGQKNPAGGFAFRVPTTALWARILDWKTCMPVPSADAQGSTQA